MSTRTAYRTTAIFALLLPFLLVGSFYGLLWTGFPITGMNTLKVGDPAPDVGLSAPGLEAVSRLSEFRGKKNVVLAFYPKAFTPHCTQQMCGYRDNIAAFQAADTELIGVSLDLPEQGQAFKEKYNLPFPLLRDPNRAIVNAYGVPVVNLFFARLLKRSVFLMDKQGVIRYINRSYSVKRDGDRLLQEIQKLMSAEKTPLLPSGETKTAPQTAKNVT
jgi:peroxiredoxin